METNHGIEHERNLNQGKRPEQNEADARNFIVGVVVVIAVLIGLVIANSLNII